MDGRLPPRSSALSRQPSSRGLPRPAETRPQPSPTRPPNGAPYYPEPRLTPRQQARRQPPLRPQPQAAPAPPPQPEIDTSGLDEAFKGLQMSRMSQSSPMDARVNMLETRLAEVEQRLFEVPNEARLQAIEGVLDELQRKVAQAKADGSWQRDAERDQELRRLAMELGEQGRYLDELIEMRDLNYAAIQEITRAVKEMSRGSKAKAL